MTSEVIKVFKIHGTVPRDSALTGLPKPVPPVIMSMW